MRKLERLGQRLRDPAVGLVHLAPHNDHVHDREDAGVTPVGTLNLGVVLKKALDFAVATQKRGGRTGGVERVNLAVMQHLRQRLRRTDGVKLDVRRQLQFELFDTPGFFFATEKIGLSIDGHVVVILKNSTNPHGGGHLIFRAGNAFPDQVFRLIDTRICINVDARVTEETRRINRQCYEGPFWVIERNAIA